MCLDTKGMERLGKARLYPVSKHRHINYIFNVNTLILYIYLYILVFRQIVLCEQSFVLYLKIEILLLSSCVLYILY